jgi:hypothetical protein
VAQRPHKVGNGFAFADPAAQFGGFPAPPPPYVPPTEVTDAWREYAEAIDGAAPYNIGRAVTATHALRRVLR